MEEKRTAAVRAMELFYRPVYDWDYQAPAGWHAEWRIFSPSMGPLLPEQVLPVAERTSQCCQLAQWALEEVCAAIAALLARGVETDWVSVYISPRYLQQEDAAARVRAALDERGASPERLCLRLPAEWLYVEEGAAAGNLRRLRDMGVHALLAGAGEPDFPAMRLTDTGCDMVSLTPALSRAITGEGRRQQAAHSLIQLINGQGMQALADGVDDKETARMLAQAGCGLTTGAFAGKVRRERQIQP